jgi:hypothetical protein
MKKIFGGDSIWTVMRINNLQHAAKMATHSFLLVKGFPKKKSKLAELCIKTAENVRGEPKPVFFSPRKNYSNFLRPVEAKTTDIAPE